LLDAKIIARLIAGEAPTDQLLKDAGFVGDALGLSALRRAIELNSYDPLNGK